MIIDQPEHSGGINESINIGPNYNSSNIIDINNPTTKDVLPNHTLYIQNLNEKIKLDELKQNLYHLFSQFGDILEIHARRSFRMKGQAFIIFRDIISATNAKFGMNNAILFGKTMRVNFSKNASDAIVKQTGSFSHKDKIKLDADRRKRRELEYQEIKKKTVTGTSKKAEKVPQAQTAQVSTSAESNIPNNTLFVESLPNDITEPILRTVFSKYGGFREVRHFPGKGIAFIEYDSEINAGGALLGLNGLNLTADCILKISFAKK